MKKTTTFLLLVFAAITAFAQTSLSGKVTNHKGEPVPFATVSLNQNGSPKAGAATDMDGIYILTGLDPGTYDLEVSEISEGRTTVKGIVIVANKQNVVDVKMPKSNDPLLKTVTVINSKTAPTEPSKTEVTSAKTLTSAEIRALPTKNLDAVVGQAAGVSQADQGKKMVIRGSREDAKETFVDGIRVSGGAKKSKKGKKIPPPAPPPAPNAPPPAPNATIHFVPPVVKADVQVKKSPPKIADLKKEENKLEKLADKNAKVVADTLIDDEVGNTDDFNALIENIFKEVKNEPLTTFSADVDRASYTTTRYDLMHGSLPDRNSVRIEEFINYFNYDYPQPKGTDPIAISTEMTTSPWNANTKLVCIGLQAVTIPVSQLPASNLVFLIDVSGSMNGENRLGLVQNALGLLVDKLRADDKVTLVVYAGAAGTVLPPTSGSQKEVIKTALNNLHAGGSTAGGAGIELAYNEALKNFVKGGNNRVILCTDGDFNVGVSSDAALQTLIEEKRKTGVFLSCLGFGMGNYKDNKMETLADKGNGNYAYIDNIQEAKKVFINEFGGTLFTVAKDVKLQIEFNPTTVKAYRLIGYENRALRNEDFNDDKKDAGDMGSGHTVTALYEILPADAVKTENLAEVEPLKYQTYVPNTAATNKELLTVKIRYKQPNADKSQKIEQVLENTATEFAKSSENFRFAAAVAEFGLLLRRSEFKAAASYAQVTDLAKAALGKDSEGYRAEFLQLVTRAKELDKGK